MLSRLIFSFLLPTRLVVFRFSLILWWFSGLCLCQSSGAMILWPLLSEAPLHPSFGHGEQQHPSLKVQQSFTFTLPHSPSFTSCSKFFHLPCWILARGNHSLPLTKLQMAHFKLSIYDPSLLSFSGTHKVAFLQKPLW